ncbi:MAG TPA: DUF2567 domain-containing protein [Pseudonocardiaceae bacterium]|nr:DUF2567 domain-containing protein [Pseudonocardiaceae bacterium]
MAEQPVERPTPTAPDWADLYDTRMPAVQQRLQQRPRVVIKADLLPAVSVASTVALLGLPLAWIWSRIAPAIPGALDANGHPVALPSPYGYHRFDDLAIFMLIGLAAGLATGVAIWMLRERRGPTILLAGVLGSAIAAWLAMHTGVSFAAGQYVLTTAPKPGAVFNIAPRLETSWVLLAQPLGAALAYCVLATWNGMNDLGRRFG